MTEMDSCEEVNLAAKTALPRVVLVSDHPMTLGVQFLLYHVLQQRDLRERFDFVGLLTAHTDFSRIEEPFSEQDRRHLLDFFRRSPPLVLGVSAIERCRHRFLALLPEIRQLAPNAIFLAGGIDASSNPDFYFSAGVDLVAIGDGEEPFSNLMSALDSGKGRQEILRDPPAGFASSEHPSRAPAHSPEEVPLPYYGDHLLTLTPDGVVTLRADHSNPQHVQFLNRAAAFDMFTRRGCTHKCSFCAQDLQLVYKNDSQRNSRRRPLKDVVDYLAGLKNEFPKKNFVYFWDLDFLRRPKDELLRFAETYAQRVGMPFFVFVTEKTVNAAGVEVIRALGEAGMRNVNMGIQSGSQRILQEVYRRRNTPDECRRAIGIIHEATRNFSVEILYDVITYNPEEKAEDVLETIQLVRSIPTDGRQTVRLSTHRLSYNTGQDHSRAADRSTSKDYQDFLNESHFLGQSRTPYLSWLLGQMMRGHITSERIGNVHRPKLDALLHEDVIHRMEQAHDLVSVFYNAFVPSDSEGFLNV